MNELRWVLLVIGVLLIAGLYFWGTRSRGLPGGAPATPKRPAVFTGSAVAFEKAEPAADAASAAEPDSAHEQRRIEPSVSLDDGFPQATRAGELDIEFPDESAAPPATGRREPTWTSRVEASPREHASGIADARTEPSFDRAAGARAALGDAVRSDPAPPAHEAPAPARPRQKIVAMRVSSVGPARLDGILLKEAILAEGLEFGRYEIFHRLHTDGRPIFSVASQREPGTFDLQAMDATTYPGVTLFAVLPGPVRAADAVDDMMFTARALAAQLGAAMADDRGVPLTPSRIARLREDALEYERSGGPA